MSKYTPVKLAYNVYEPTTGETDEELSPVIFLHGSSGAKEMWDDIPQLIADKTKRKTYALDARNHGDSEWTDVFNFDINADDLLHFMDIRSIQKAVLCGHSMGGIASIRVALTKPERVEMVFVEDIYVKKIPQQYLDSGKGVMDIFQAAVDNIPTDCDEKDAKSYIIKYIFERIPADNKIAFSEESMSKTILPLKRDAEGRYHFKSNQDVILKSYENVDSLMSEPEGLYEGPAFFIYGVKSIFLVNEEEDHIKKFFPNAELIGIEDSDHWVHNLFPEKFTEILLRYL